MHELQGGNAHLTADALPFQLLSSLQIVSHHLTISYQCDICTFSLHLQQHLLATERVDEDDTAKRRHMTTAQQNADT